MADMRLRAKDRAASSEPSRLLAALQEGYNEAGETVQDYVDRTLANNEKVMSGEINAGQRLLRSTGDVVGLFGGLAGDTLGVIGDLVVPDEFGVEAAYQRNIEKPLQEAAKDFGVNPKAEMWRLPAPFVGEYAEKDAEITLKLWHALQHEITKQDLWDVFNLETNLFPCLVDMKFKGVRVDLDVRHIM